MPLKYALFENHLTDDPNDYMAKVQDVQPSTFDDVIDLMISRGSTVTRAEAMAVFEEYGLALEQLLREGRSVNTPLFNLTPSIKGVFFGLNDPFEASRHQVRINVKPGTRLRQIEAQIPVERVSPTERLPNPREFVDANSGARNGPLTPGGLGTLLGDYLKFNPNDTEQGIFFIDAAEAATRVTVISVNKPKELHFLVPATLASGTYSVEVRAILPQATQRRTGVLPHPLQVP